MEYIKRENLIEGEIYVYNEKFINKITKQKRNEIDCYINKNSNSYQKPNTRGYSNNIDRIRLATPEEKHWLNECIKLDKFITFEEAIKTFIPEYVKCIKVLGKELTLEQFRRYVLKEEIVEEKVIKPLPQFKVIETIETITKVENNEGNQFFIGDTVKSLDSNQKGEILKFRYSFDKSNIIAITTFQSNNGISINKIEHYIEPKDNFVLPEKFCLKITHENINFCKSLKNKELGMRENYKYYIGGYYSSITSPDGLNGFTNIPKNYTEITFKQFKKYVLNENN